MKLETEKYIKIAKFATENGMSHDEIKGIFVYAITAMCSVDMKSNGRDSVGWINSDDEYKYTLTVTRRKLTEGAK